MDKKALTIRLSKSYQKGQRALTQLIEIHGGLARTIAMRFRRKEQCCTLDDLVQEARRGLIDGAGHYDPARGAFSTVASIWIRKRILAHIEKTWQLGPQVDDLDTSPASEPTQRVFSVDKSKAAARIKRLQKRGVLNETDVAVIQAAMGTDEEREALLRPIFASWYRDKIRAVISKATRSARTPRCQMLTKVELTKGAEAS